MEDLVCLLDYLIASSLLTSLAPLMQRFFDISKQITGQLFVHGVNVLISGIVAQVSSGNACVLYFLNILIDTTLGKTLTAHRPGFTL